MALLSAGSYLSDICRAEQQRALEKGKCVIPIRVQTESDIPLYLQTRQWLDFSNPKLYPELLPRLIESIEKQSGVGVSAESLIRYNNAPAMPENFVNRPELLEALRNTLFAEAANRNIALTAMQGMGGIGKTVLAQALCRDEVVQQAFPDGIFWFTIGKESQLDFIARIKSVPGLDRLLGPYDGEAACLAQYRDVLRKKAALIVVDDVWRASDVQSFLAESPRSRLLITTRDTSIGAWFGAREFTVELLTDAQSRQVLAKWCGRAVANLPPQATDVIHECGYLPLALAMIGAQLRGKPLVLWNSVLDHLRHADLQKIKAQFPEPHTTLFRAIQISVDALDETARQRYLALAVLLEDMAAAPQVQQCIWGVDETGAAETAEQIISLSLAQRDQPKGSIRLHDLQLHYVRTQYPQEDREALDLIHGAIRLSLSVITNDPEQFPSQMVGRLLPLRDISAVQRFVTKIGEGYHKTWLCPLQPTLFPPGAALICSLIGHELAVNAVALTPDGERAISAADDATLKIWDIVSGLELQTLYGHSAGVHAVAISEDGRIAISASKDKTLRVWELASGEELRVLRGHTRSVLGVALDRDGRCAVSASEDNTLKVWDVANGRELHTLSSHQNIVHSVALSAEGGIALSASADNTLKVWDVKTGCQTYTLKGHASQVCCVAISRDGKVAVSASRDKTLKVWDLASGRAVHTLGGHSDWVTGVALSCDGRIAISASLDRLLKVWDVESGRELQTLEGHSLGVNAVALSGNGRLGASASSDKTLRVWQLDGGRKLSTLRAHSDWVNDVALSEDGHLAISASSDKTLKAWDSDTGRCSATFVGHAGTVTSVVLTSDGRRIVSGSSDLTLKVWAVNTGHEIRTLCGHSDWVNDLSLSRDGRIAVSASSDNSLKIWDLMKGSEIFTLEGHEHWVLGVALSLNSRVGVSASRDTTVRVWDLSTGTEVRTLWGHSDWVNGVAISADGRLAVSASRDKTLKVWEVESGRELRTLTGHTGGVYRVAMSGDGQRAVSASDDNTVKLWDLETGEVLATFTCDGAARCCAFSEAHKLIVAGDAGGHLHFLRLEEPKVKG